MSKAKVYDGSEHAPEDNPEVRHEHRDVNIRGIVITGIVLLVVVTLAHAVLFGLFNLLQSEREQADAAVPPVIDAEQLPPAPRLQPDPPADWQQLVNEQDQLLSTYEWVDQDAGSVRIPIERAMEVLLERGLPVREGGQLPAGLQGEPGLGPAYELESEGGQELEALPEQGQE
jgi:hypothetical protein